MDGRSEFWTQPIITLMLIQQPRQIHLFHECKCSTLSICAV